MLDVDADSEPPMAHYKVGEWSFHLQLSRPGPYYVGAVLGMGASMELVDHRFG